MKWHEDFAGRVFGDKHQLIDSIIVHSLSTASWVFAVFLCESSTSFILQMTKMQQNEQ